MKHLAVALALTISTGPALASWEIQSSDTKKTWHYAAFEADKTTAIELQFYCDNEYPKDFQILIFTNVDADPDAEFLQDVAVDATIGGEQFADLAAYDDEVDGERVIVIDTLEEDRARDILDKAIAATQPLQFRYEETGHAFGTDEIQSALTQFRDGCTR